MNKQQHKIAFIVQHERFPLATNEKVVLGIIAAILLGLIAVILTRTTYTILQLCLVLGIGALLFAVIYMGMLSSLYFHKIITTFNQEKNSQLIVYCLSRLNMNAYKDPLHENVFVCFVHNKQTFQREEIYLIAKANKILITSNKEKQVEKENPFEIDFVERIGSVIHQTAKYF